MKKNIYTEYSDYFQETFDVPNKKDDMVEILKVMRKIEVMLQVLTFSTICILLTLLIR